MTDRANKFAFTCPTIDELFERCSAERLEGPERFMQASDVESHNSSPRLAYPVECVGIGRR